MRYYLKVFGCQMNQSDAERISTILEKNKMKLSASIEEADFVIFVTCGVRQTAEDRVYGQIHNIKKKNPEKIIILTGCLAHRKDVQRRLKGKVDLFTTIKDFPKEVVSCIKYHVSSIKNKKIHNTLYKIHNTKKTPRGDYLKISPGYSNSYTAYIPIMTGCNNFCSYCVVPYARGREYSRPADDILKEVKGLIKKRYKEIILLGQNVNSYKDELGIRNQELWGKNKKPDSKFMIHDSKKKIISFADLLKLVDAIQGKFWLTFLTSHPKDMSDELIETIAKSKKICKYINLPAQSGDNEILRKMNRKYTIEHYKSLIKKIRRAYSRSHLESTRGETSNSLPPSISTDIIVGFPGETKKQFENTAQLLHEMKFDMAYINQYSPRPETAAWRLKDNVSKKEKTKREKVLTKILEKTAFENNKKYIGKIVEVLVDGGNPMSSWTSDFQKVKYLAHTRTQKKVIFHSNKKIPVGNFVKVKIIKSKAFGLEGKMN